MARDGDGRQIGDPVSRLSRDDTAIHSLLGEIIDPVRLTDEQLRRQLTNLDQIIREALGSATPSDISEQAELRLRQLNIEHRRRAAAASH